MATALRGIVCLARMCRFCTGATMVNSATSASRIDWVDYAKGICIILVVMMHSTLGVEKAIGQTGHLHQFIEWATPFRMPDFFLISGLFLARRIAAPWRGYLDTKVVHFAYFYILWMTIQFAMKGPGMVMEQGVLSTVGTYALGFVEPFGTLWFIYLLAIFFVVTKAVKDVPPLMVFVAAALLEMLPLHTGWMVIDEFASRYVYFFTGYWLAQHIFKWAEHLWLRNAFAIMAVLYMWSVVNSYAVISGFASAPLIGLFLGFAGAGAVIATGVLLARTGLAEWLRYLGANSIVIYLSFFLFMAVTRSAALKLMPTVNVDILAAVTTMAGVLGPVLLFWTVRGTRLSFLFKRPAWIGLKPVETLAKPTYSAGYDHILQQPQAR
jgi:uncharacterized membrane protein YcfT